jgi:hypothetical protein
MDKKEIQQKADEALLDIIRGYSVLGAYNHEFYFKHFSILDSLELENDYRIYLRSAINSGIKPEEALINEAIKNKKWSVNKEEQIKSLIWSIDKLGEAAKKINDHHQRKSAEQNIESKKTELAEIQKERAALCVLSAESFAETRKIKKFITNSLYKDSHFETKFEELDAFSHSKQLFEKIEDLNNPKIVANAAYNTCFFELFSLNYRQPEIFFQNKGLYLTAFQKNLLVYANAILNKIKNVSIPDQIYNDPIKILNYVEQNESSNISHGIEDLKAKSLQNGGKITAEDFLSK